MINQCTLRGGMRLLRRDTTPISALQYLRPRRGITPAQATFGRASLLVSAVLLTVTACGHGPSVVQSSSSHIPATSTAVSANAGGAIAPPCPLSLDFIRTTTAPVLGDGPVSTKTYPNGDCSYVLSSGAKVGIVIYPYSKNEILSVGVGGAYGTTDQKYGGSSPQQVYSSTRAAYQAIAAVDPGRNGFADYPTIGGGLVTNNMGEFVLAGLKGCWYTGVFSNTKGDTAYNDPSVKIAQALAAL